MHVTRCRGNKMDFWVGTGDSAKLRWIAAERLEKFTSNTYWTDVNLSTKHLYTQRAPVKSLSVYSPPFVVGQDERTLRPSYASVVADESKFRPCKVRGVGSYEKVQGYTNTSSKLTFCNQLNNVAS